MLITSECQSAVIIYFYKLIIFTKIFLVISHQRPTPVQLIDKRRAELITYSNLDDW